ncbi:DUF2087 domain-containing protein [Kitasatospora sp. NPDC006697]|uniref:DUF2087 domain-containing protein n=1 Tax=Kitasatospora sp. NPDC006697 TaxID=3364020 RepID=UPI0036929686
MTTEDSSERPAGAGTDAPPAELAAFFTGGRLTAVPRKPARRLQVLLHLTETLFAPERRYSEPEVNEALRGVHEDYSALRRYLVEARLLVRTRDGSSYRRGEPAGSAGAA